MQQKRTPRAYIRIHSSTALAGHPSTLTSDEYDLFEWGWKVAKPIYTGSRREGERYFVHTIILHRTVVTSSADIRTLDYVG